MPALCPAAARLASELRSAASASFANTLDTGQEAMCESKAKEVHLFLSREQERQQPVLFGGDLPNQRKMAVPPLQGTHRPVKPQRDIPVASHDHTECSMARNSVFVRFRRRSRGSVREPSLRPLDGKTFAGKLTPGSEQDAHIGDITKVPLWECQPATDLC